MLLRLTISNGDEQSIGFNDDERDGYPPDDGVNGCSMSATTTKCASRTKTRSDTETRGASGRSVADSYAVYTMLTYSASLLAGLPTFTMSLTCIRDVATRGIIGTRKTFFTLRVLTIFN